MTTSWRHRVWPWIFVGHAVLVVVLTIGFVALSQAGSEGDANIGAGLLGLPLITLGLPWSISYTTGPHAIDQLSQAVMVCLPALLNLVLHGVVLAIASRRRARRFRSGLESAKG